LTGAIARDWVEVLQGFPRDVLQQAAMRYLRDEPNRKPTPGAMYQLALGLMPMPKVVHRAPVDEPQTEPKMTAERAAEVMREVGFRPRAFPTAGEAE
jgi:hypothetical protein